jgi:ATP-binding cassette subfamily B protein
LAIAIGVFVERAAVGGNDSRPLVDAAVVLFALLAAERVLPTCQQYLRLVVSRMVDGGLRQEVVASIAEISPLTEVEGAEMQSRVGLIRGGFFGTPGAAAVASVEVAGRYLQTVAALVVVGWFSPPLALVTFAVIVFIRRRWHASFGALADELVSGALAGGRAGYFAELLLGAPAAKEVRVYSLAALLEERYGNEWADAHEGGFAVRARLRRRSNLELGLLAASYVATFTLAARAAVNGDIGLGLLAAILQAEFAAAQLISPGESDYATAGGVAAVRAVADLKGRGGGRPTTSAVPDPGGPPHRCIELRSVSFAYPGGESVLQGLDLTLEAGSSTAIVGLNGAGKTTLVKLLTGLYEPSEGTVLVDGVQVADMPTARWQAQIAAIFQDFVRYELTAEDNVVLGSVAHRVDVAARDRALARTGASAVVDDLPDGLATTLAAGYEGGVDLSGGQWQRMALARALFAVECGARVLVLDEPTASLDVRLEADLYDRLLDLTAGLTSVVISHRFSTVRRAQRILVLEGGQIIEDGSHAELVAAGGEYARLYELQSERFADDGEAGYG